MRCVADQLEFNRREMGERARMYAIEMFSEKNAEKIIQFLEE
jgi:hypothetical protein